MLKLLEAGKDVVTANKALLAYHGGDTETGKYKVDGDTLYIGTIKYVRDDFNRIVDLKVIDERAAAVAHVQEEFGETPESFVTALWLPQLPWESVNSP